LLQLYCMGVVSDSKMIVCRMWSRISVATRKHTMLRQKYCKGGGKRAFGGGQKCTKYYKINNNSENFRRQDCCQGGFCPPSPPPVAGLSRISSASDSYSKRTPRSAAMKINDIEKCAIFSEHFGSSLIVIRASSQEKIKKRSDNFFKIDNQLPLWCHWPSRFASLPLKCYDKALTLLSNCEYVEEAVILKVVKLCCVDYLHWGASWNLSLWLKIKK